MSESGEGLLTRCCLHKQQRTDSGVRVRQNVTGVKLDLQSLGGCTLISLHDRHMQVFMLVPNVGADSKTTQFGLQKTGKQTNKSCT